MIINNSDVIIEFSSIQNREYLYLSFYFVPVLLTGPTQFTTTLVCLHISRIESGFLLSAITTPTFE